MRIVGVTRRLPGETVNGDAFFLARLGAQWSVQNVVVSSVEAETPSSVAMLELPGADNALLAVVDGVGHGPDAAAATATVLSCLRRQSGLDLVSLARECHRAALGTRGSTLGLVRLCPARSRVDYVGVGDVRMRRVGRRQGHSGVSTQRLVNNNGIVGYRLPGQVQQFSEALGAGDMVVLSSDGIKEHVDLSAMACLELEAVAETLVQQYARERDDATVVVAR